MKGIWLLPSRGRPHALATFFEAAVKTGISTGGVILVHEEDWVENHDKYEALNLPTGWGFCTGHANGLAATLQEAWETGDLAEMDWVGILSDDMTPETPEWDIKLISRISGYNIVAANDGWQAPKRLAACVYSREILSAVGYFAPPGMKHLFFDDVWEKIGADTGCILYAGDVMLRHNHQVFGKDATSARIASFWDSDEQVFREWRRTSSHLATEAVFGLIASKGEKVIKLDLSNISLLIGIPVYDEYTPEFFRSFNATRDALQAHGAFYEMVEVGGCSDIALARARLLGTFLRSKHTHLAQIDTDMGWLTADFLRLFEHGYEFTCAAGPKKKDPLEVAFENTGPDGKPAQIISRDGGVTVEITRVGMAFTVLSRSCVEKMVEAYGKELQFEMEGRTEYGVFDPIYEGVYPNRRRLSEDYSFCARWLAIGGKINMLPHVRLKHVGKRVFEGCYLDILMQQAAETGQRLEMARQPVLDAAE